MNLRAITIGFLICLCANGASPGAPKRGAQWPKITPLEKEFHLYEKSRAGVQFNILNQDKKPLYSFQCYINAQDRVDNDFDWMGDFMCRLTPLPVEKYPHINLLANARSVRNWDTRAAFDLSYEVVPVKVEGVPIRYPGRGRTRLFKLRGMDIEITVIDFTLAPAQQGQYRKVTRLVFKVTAKSDTSAHSSAAESLSYTYLRYPSIRWPAVTSSKRKVHFAGHELKRIPIYGQNKRILYALHCCLNPTGDDQVGGLLFSSDFHCFLFSTYDSLYSSGFLLCSDHYPVVDWEGRGLFAIGDLIGKCGEYPDYGRTREFRLRGMDLTLSIENLKLTSVRVGPDSTEKKIQSLDLEVRAVPDSRAVDDIAAPSKYLEPLIRDPKDPSRFIRDCNHIRLRNKP